MAGNWAAFNIDLGPINPIAKGVEAVTTAVSTALTIQKTALDIVAALALDLLNVEALLIKAALSIIEDVLEDYILTDAKIHALVVSPRRQLPYKLASEITMPQDEDSWSIDDEISSESKARFQKILKVVGEHDQGNPGFARTVIESLYDEHDPNKPDYDENDAIFGVVILAGAQTMLGLYDLLAAIQGIFGASLSGNPLLPADVTKTPQGLKAIPISAPGTNRIGVRLKWNNAPAIQTLAAYLGARVTILELAIIRSQDDGVMIAENWGTIFGGEQPAVLPDDVLVRENVTASGGSKLIRIFKHDGIRDTYIDDDEELQKDTDYYYTVAYRYALAEGADGTESLIVSTPQDFHQISNVVRVRVPTKGSTTHLSVQPNWMTHASLLDMIPDLKFFMALVQNYVAALKSRLLGPASALATYIKFLQAEVTRYNAFARDINARIARLASLFQLPATGIYMTVMGFDKGGTPAFTREMLERLMDEADDTAPPFFRNGLVGGLVLVAGAPNPAELESTKTLISLLLGLSADGDTAYEEAVASIDVVLTDLEDVTFGEDMQPGGTPTTKTQTYQTFNDEMEPVDADDPKANIAFDP